MTETAQMADVVLPTTCFAEKDGTFANTERRVQRVRKAVTGPGSVRDDWRVTCDIATRMGYPMHYPGGVPRHRFYPARRKARRRVPALTTGRVLYQYHSGTMTMKTEGLNEKSPENFVEISADDADRLGLADGEMVRISSRRGEIMSRLSVSEKAVTGTVFMPFHFAEAAANKLTNAALDPVSKIPAFKVCAVKVERAA